LASIIGIGLNVNQINFDMLPKASSLKTISGTSYELEVLLHKILSRFQNKIKNYFNTDFKALKQDYTNVLFRKRKVSTFKTPSQQIFLGIITDITDEGKLLLELEDGIRIATYDIKEIQLMY